MFNLGKFKKRPRQPSILGTAQKERQARPEYDEDEDDFNPEDESTPLNLSKTRDMASSSASTSNSRKRKLAPRSSTTTERTLVVRCRGGSTSDCSFLWVSTS